VAAILAELEPLRDEDFEALPKDLPEDLPDDLPDDLPEEVLDEVVDLDAFSCSRLSVWHSKMLCPLCLQWEHFFPLSFFFFPLPELFA
jgi:hypothetical protein